MEDLREGVVGEQTPAEWRADTGDEFDGLEGLEAADDSAQRAEDARFAATGHTALGRWGGEEAAIARTAARGIENGHLAFEFEYAAVDQRPLREERGVVVKVTGGEIIGAVDDHIVGGEQGEGVADGHAVAMFDDLDEGIRRAQSPRGGGDFGFADGSGVVEELALEVMIGDLIEVGDAERPDSGGREVEGGGTAESAGTNDEHAGAGEFTLTIDADFAEEDMPAVARKFGGREMGQRSGHRREREREARSSQMNLRRKRTAVGIMGCVILALIWALAASDSRLATSWAWRRRCRR